MEELLQYKKLVYGYEIIPLFGQLICNAQGCLHRGFETVVHKDDGAVMNLVFHDPADAVRILCFPVQGIDIPEDREHGNGEIKVFPPCAEGWPDVGGISSRKFDDLVAGFFNFFFCGKLGNSVQMYMVIGMVSDQMSFILDAFYQVFVSRNILSHKKKGGVEAPLFQPVEKEGRIFPTWPVIKGEADFRGFQFFFHFLFHKSDHALSGNCDSRFSPKILSGTQGNYQKQQHSKKKTDHIFPILQGSLLLCREVLGFII